MNNSSSIKRRDPFLPALAVAVTLAGSYWILELLLVNYLPASRLALSSLLDIDAVTAKRILVSALIGVAGTAAAMIVCRRAHRLPTSSSGHPLIRLDSQHEVLLEATFDGILLVSEQGKVRKANATAGTMFGGEPSLFEGLAASTFFSLDDEPIQLEDDRVVQQFEPGRCLEPTRVTALGLNGRSFPAQIRASEIALNGTRHFVLCIQELTAEVQAEVALQRAESRYRNLFGNMLEGVYKSTADGKILTANAALVRLLGFASVDELKCTITTPDLYRYPEERRQLVERLARMKSVRNHEIELVRKDGTFVTVIANIRAIHSDAESGTIYEGTISNISDVVAARTALRHGEELFRAMTEHALDIVTVLAQNGDSIYISPSAGKLSGMGPEYAVGRNVFPAIHRDDLESVKAVLHKAFADPGSPHQFTFRFFRGDGQVLFLESVGSAYRTYDGELRAVVHSRDISERLRTEAKLQQAQKMQAVGQLTGGIAHDFNNLLTVIVGNLQLLEKQVEKPSAVTQVKTALRASMQGAELTRRLLAFSRRQFLEPKVIDVNELLIGMEPIVRRSLSDSVAVHRNYAEDIWPTKIDPAQLEDALLNLALNAADAMPCHGDLTLSTHNQTLATGDLPSDSSGDAGDYVCVTVADTGCGMSELVVERSIEPFFSTKGDHDGSGLGLSMVYGFVRQSGGHMTIDSKPAAGARIRLFLPRSKEPITETAQNHYNLATRKRNQLDD